MDQSRIDDLTRLVARRTGRRKLVAGALAGLFGGLVPGLGALDAEAKKKRGKPKKRRCKKPKRRCGKQCVNVRSHRQHCGTCRRQCPPGHACRRRKCVPPPTCGNGGACRVFITNSRHDGNLGGLAGADAICTRIAREAGLPGTYMAWLSNRFGSPASRFTKNPGPYVRVDGIPVANNWADLTDGALLARINKTETGLPAPTADGWPWTSTTPSGTWSEEDNCQDWTSTSGEGSVGSSQASRLGTWSQFGFLTCSNKYFLYCFQQS